MKELSKNVKALLILSETVIQYINIIYYFICFLQEAEVSFENHAKGDVEGENNQHEMNNSEQNTTDMKSLSELEKENKQVKVDLDKSKDQILQLKNQLKDLTQKLQDIEKLFEDGDIPSDKRDALSQILTG